MTSTLTPSRGVLAAEHVVVVTQFVFSSPISRRFLFFSLLLRLVFLVVNLSAWFFRN